MNNPKLLDEFSEIIKEFKKYIELKYNIAKLDIIEKLVITASLLFTSFIILILMPLAFFFLPFGLSLYLGSVLGATHYGFFITGGFILIITLIIILLRKKLITNPILKLLLSELFTKDNGKGNKD